MSEILVPDARELQLTNLDFNSPSQVNRSAWTGRRKVIGLAGTETWQGTASVSLIATEAEERQWRAFLFGLKGPENWFRWPLPRNSHIGAKPKVASGAGDGYSLPLTGMQPNTRILQAGQFITVPLPSGHARSLCLMADLRTDASGNATATFEPALNEAPTQGATVETVAPYVPMSPVDPTVSLNTVEGVSSFSIAVEEAL